MRLWRIYLVFIMTLPVGAFPLNAQEEEKPPLETILRKVEHDDAAPKIAAPKLRLLAMPDLVVNPVDEDDANPDDDPDHAYQVILGEYYPYLDLRRQGDPTTMGYTKVFTSMNMNPFEGSRFTVGLFALTPAGLSSGGLANGPTWISPSFSWFQDLGDGAGIQGFFGQSVHANHRWRSNLGSGFQTGLAWQSAVPGFTQNGQTGLFFYLQAYTSFHNDASKPENTPLFWEVFPGVTWHLNECCWFSLAASRFNFLACTWRF